MPLLAITRQRGPSSFQQKLGAPIRRSIGPHGLICLCHVPTIAGALSNDAPGRGGREEHEPFGKKPPPTHPPPSSLGQTMAARYLTNASTITDLSRASFALALNTKTPSQIHADPQHPHSYLARVPESPCSARAFNPHPAGRSPTCLPGAAAIPTNRLPNLSSPGGRRRAGPRSPRTGRQT